MTLQKGEDKRDIVCRSVKYLWNDRHLRESDESFANFIRNKYPNCKGLQKNIVVHNDLKSKSRKFAVAPKAMALKCKD